MQRRGFIKYGSFALGTLGVIACGKNTVKKRAPVPGGVADAENVKIEPDAAKSADLTVIYTKEDPGPWAGKEAKHIPTLTADKAKFTVETPHVMEADHYISRHQIRDEGDKILADRVLDAKTPKPISSFFIEKPLGTEIQVYSTCNQHGIWMAKYPIADIVAGFIAAPIYAAENPGQWIGKENSHVPTLVKGALIGINGDLGMFTLDMTNTHPMEEAHYICRHQLRDDSGLVVAENRLTPGIETTAASSFNITLPAVGNIHAYSTCNIHGTWKASYPVSSLRGVWSDTVPAPSGAAAATHVPVVTRLTNTTTLGEYAVQVSNTHVMTQDVHYITKHEIRDADGLFMAEQYYQNPLPIAASVVLPSSMFTIASAPFQFLALCNVHGYWKLALAYDELHHVYTDTAGPAGGAPETHKPAVVVTASEIKLSTDHVMQPTHYIACHQIRDVAGQLLGLKMFNLATNLTPVSTFLRSPAMSGALKAYSICNLHGIWKTEFTAT